MLFRRDSWRFLGYARNDRNPLFFDFLEMILEESVFASAGAGEAAVQPFSALADPSDLTGGDPGHQSVIFYVAGDYGTRCYEGAAANCVAADHRAVRAQGRALAYARTQIDSVRRKVRAGRIHVSENARRAAKYVVFQLNAFIYRDVVLYSDSVTDPDIASNVHVLP